MISNNASMNEKRLMTLMEEAINKPGTGINGSYFEEDRTLKIYSLTKHKAIHIVGNGNGGADMVLFLHSMFKGDHEEIVSFPLNTEADAKEILKEVIKEMKKHRES